MDRSGLHMVEEIQRDYKSKHRANALIDLIM